MRSELLSFGKNMCSEWFLPHEDAETHQRKKLNKLLSYAWQNSNFYQQHLIAHGINEHDLAHVELEDLPFTNKTLLMEHFDDFVTDPQLSKAKLEHWMRFHPNNNDLYCDKYRVLHTSGTSASQGIFVYDQSVWENNCYKLLFSVLKPSIDTLKIFLRGKLRVAFIGATDGHYTGVSYAKQLPRAICHVMDLSINMEHDKLTSALNDFQPHYVVGYANALKVLSNQANEGKLNLKPHGVVNSGEQLTRDISDSIIKAFGIAPVNLYIATEGAIGFSLGPDRPMELHEDLMITEVIDEQGNMTEQGDLGQIVITNLNNLAMPLIRYKIDDQAIPEYRANNKWCHRLTKLYGRNYSMVPIMTQDGKHETLHPNLLVEFYNHNIEQFQFISNSQDEITIRYVATEDYNEEVLSEFNLLLAEKNAVGSTRVKLERMSFIPPDPNGKTKLVKVEIQPEYALGDQITLHSRLFS